MSAQNPKVLVWDWPLRAFHWLLVLCLCTSLYTGLYNDWDLGRLTGIELYDPVLWHHRSGYSILALLLFRIIWGLLGPPYSLFSSFLRSPTATLRYLRAPYPSLGHNPAGGWMILLLLLTLAIQAVTGLFSDDDSFLGDDGPLAHLPGPAVRSLLDSIHHQAYKIVALLVGLHLIALAAHRLLLGEQLAMSMLHGKKTGWLPAEPGITSHKGWLAMLLAALLCALAYLIAQI